MLGSISPVFNPGSVQAAVIAHLFIIVLIVCGIILSIVVGMVGIGLTRFRQSPGMDEPQPYFGNRKLEIIWTVIPALIVMWLLVLTAQGMAHSDPDVNQQPDLIVIGHQWWWEVRYPLSGVVTANEIHIPIGRRWLVRLESADVIHDFWVPSLARKIDVVPGYANAIWLEASSPGKYAGTCAEYCGAQHAWMRFAVIAELPAVFDAWMSGQETPAAFPVTEPERTGMLNFQAMTCVNCHSIRGVSPVTDTAPDLTHLAGREVLGAGVLSITESNLFRWLKNPQAFKPACHMPNLNLSDAQATTLASYLVTLK